jgi:hypothetical protein
MEREIREALEQSIGWCSLDRAIQTIGECRGVHPEEAWKCIKQWISLDSLPAQCIDDRGERVRLEPHWIKLLAKFQLPAEPRINDLPVGVIAESFVFNDYPHDGILWFDQKRAAENRLARKKIEANRFENSLPPIRVRDVRVDEVRLEVLANGSALRPGLPDRESSPEESEARFVDWMNSQKKAHGVYPSRDMNLKAPERRTWGEWAREKGISREVAAKWVAANKLSEPRGAPRRKSAQK